MPNRPLGNIAKQNPLVTAAPDTLVSEAAELMRDAEASALVVIDEDAIVGIVTERDIVFRVVADELEPDQTLVGGVMTANPIVLDSSAPLKLALHVMRENSFRHIPVLEYGRVVGFVSSADALGVELKEFEIEAEMYDHYNEIL